MTIDRGGGGREIILPGQKDKVTYLKKKYLVA